MPNPHKWRWTSKPPIGAQFHRGHEMAPRLSAYIPLNEGGGKKAFDLVGGVAGTLSGGATWGSGGVVCDGVTGNVTFLSRFGASRAASALLCGAFINTATQNGAIIKLGADPNNGTDGFCVYLSSNGHIQILADEVAFFDTGVLYTPGYHVFGMSTDAQNNVYAYYDGNLIGKRLIAAIQDADAHLYLGGYTGAAASRYVACTLQWAAVMPLANPIVEVASLYSDPYQMIAPPPALRFVSLPSGGGGAAVAAFSRAGHVNGSPFSQVR